MAEDIRKSVQKKYGRLATGSTSCCQTSCAGPSAQDLSASVGYSPDELRSIPAEANLGLGCGNPVALASLREGETVLDLGSGGGIDCFLAAQKVGPQGRVIGVDMTPEMVHRARDNAHKSAFENVEFRLGEIENLPVADQSVDVAISNCVINLSPDKERVFREIYRVLKAGGRMMVADIVLTGELPERVKQSVEAYTDCIGGAMAKADYLAAIQRAGFSRVRVTAENQVPVDLWSSFPTADSIGEEGHLTPAELKAALQVIASVKVYGEK